MVLGIELSREGYSLRRHSNKTRRDTHANRCTNCNLETQDIKKSRQHNSSKISKLFIN
jgi:hypothetical protein